jgi:Carboxypeptidase regulatory-like domain/TonB-dependent Receptor Plug Domain
MDNYGHNAERSRKFQMPYKGSDPMRNKIVFGHFKYLSLLLCTALSFALSSQAGAQVVGGTVLGVLTDSTGAVVPHANVSIENNDTKISRVILTNRDGFYQAPNLLPGTYTVSGTAPGFRTTQIRGVIISVGAQQVVDLRLAVGAASSEVVYVSSEDSVLPLASSDLGAQVTGEVIRDLPLNGRSWTDLATLEPGVGTISTQPSFVTGGDRGNRGFGNELTISGERPQQNNYRFDGISLNDYANGGPGSVLGGNLGVDAVEGFSVITSNALAEYGKNSGGIVNATTRSGTNQFHGEVYEFIRNSALDARDYFNRGSSAPFKRNQFGVAVGGPIHKDQTFFFFNYEGLRQSQSVSTVAIVPSASARSGILGNSDGTTTTVKVDPAAAKYLAFWPLPNAGLVATGNNNTGLYDFGGQQVASENFYLGRIDHRFSAKDSAFGSYMYDKTRYTYPDGLNDILFGSTTARQVVVLEESHTFYEHLINTLRFGVNREAASNNQTQAALIPAAGDPSYGALPGRDAAEVTVSGITRLTGGMGSSGDGYGWTSYQLYNDAFYSKGNHSMKFGLAFERMQANINSPSTPTGQFGFGSLTAFLTNKPTQFSASLPSSIPTRDLRETLVGGYVQDDWRILRNLTLNLGLRYEMTTVPTETSGRLAALRNLSDATPAIGNHYFQNPTLTNFEPRVGFAWDPTHGGKTVLRGGFGIYDVLPLPYEFLLTSTSAAPFAVQGTVKNSALPAGSFYTGASSLLGPTSLGGAYIQPDPKRNYLMQWQLDVQRTILRDLTGVIAYVGSRGVHQPYYSDQFDIVLPTVTQSGFFWPTNPIGSGTILNPNYGSIRGVMWTGSSNYNALQLSLLGNIKKRLRLQAAFTLSKSIDTSSGSIASDAMSNSISNPPFFDVARSRGLSDFNAGKIFVFSSTWQVPNLTSSRAIGEIANGWQLNEIVHVNTGNPYTPTYGSNGDPLGSGGLQDYPDRLTPSGCKSLTNPGNIRNYVKLQCFAVPAAGQLGNAGRNIITGPGIATLDASLFKMIRLPGRLDKLDLQFRTEVFNGLNHPNFALPSNTDVFDSTGAPVGSAGLLTATSTSSRQIQFGLKMKW